MEIEAKVLLLGIYKKKEDENLNDVLIILEDAGVFTLKDGKQILKKLKNDGFINNGALTFTGIEKAKEAEAEFKI